MIPLETADGFLITQNGLRRHHEVQSVKTIIFVFQDRGCLCFSLESSISLFFCGGSSPKSETAVSAEDIGQSDLFVTGRAVA